MRRSRSSITNLEHILNLEVPTLFKASESDKSNSGSPSQSLDETQNNESNDEEDDNTEDVVVKSEATDNHPSPASSADTSDHIRLAENLKCNYCTFVAKDNTRLSRHQTCHTGSGDGRQQAKKQRFKCPYCPQCFENLTKFSLHVSCHPGLIKYTLLTCKQCDFNSNQKHNMLRHIETRCSVKKFGCERCSFTSVHRSNVQRHVFRVHEKYRYKICKLCGYRTLSNVLIRQHIQDKHTDATDESLMPRPSWKYACVECHLKMDAGTKMKCHIGRHFNYKPYVCETCSADFASPDEMRKHIRR
ncbi:hypothetical protein LOTGIDRAFT_107543, partial [Lottia gigantea]